MSQTLNARIQFWKSAELSYRQSIVGYSRKDTARIANAIVLWCLTDVDIIDDSRSWSHKSAYTWGHAVAKHDICEVQTCLKDLLMKLRDYNKYMGSNDIDSFKQSLFPTDLHRLVMRPVNKVLNRFLNTHTGFQIINTHLCFISRLTLKDKRDQESEAIMKFCSFDRIHNTGWRAKESICCRGTEIIPLLRSILSDLEIEAAYPFHSSGATYHCKRGTSYSRKQHFVVYDSRVRQFLSRMDIAADHAIQRLFKSKTRVPEAYQDRVLRIAAVPKGVDKKRIVCNENTTNMFLQHALDTALRSAVHSDYPKWHINLYDQEINRRACFVDAYGTYDLSSASDSVPHWLVRAIFPRNIYYLGRLCRSSSYEYKLDDKTYRRPLYMWRPAGAADCFVFETIVFTAICIAANTIMGVDDYFVVYGDDIITGDTIYPVVGEILETLGFIINKDKSFPPYSSFKESCGIEVFDGIDVTPLRMSRFFDIMENGDALRIKRSGKSSKPKVDGWVDFANSALSYGCYWLRAYLVSYILTVKPDQYFGPDDLHSITYDNWRLKKYPVLNCKENPYQYTNLCKTKAWVVKQGRGSDQLNYYNWLRTHRSGVSDESISYSKSGPVVGRYRTTTKHSWHEL